MSHTCRRSFCTNEFLDGTPVQLIMGISGHKTEKAFRRLYKGRSDSKSIYDKKALGAENLFIIKLIKIKKVFADFKN